MAAQSKLEFRPSEAADFRHSYFSMDGYLRPMLYCGILLSLILVSFATLAQEVTNDSSLVSKQSLVANLWTVDDFQLTAPFPEAENRRLLRSVDMVVAKGTKIKSLGTLRLPIGKDDEKIDVQRIRLISGAAEVEMLQNKKERGLLFEAAHKLQVLMTEGSVRITQHGDSIGVIVKEGSVRIGREGRFKRWEAGKMGVFKAKNLHSMPQLETPEMDLASTLFSHYDRKKEMAVKVEPVLDATQYWLMVQDQAGQLRQLSHFENINAVPLIDVETAGIFKVSVWAENAYGLLSPQSKSWQLRIIGFGSGLLAVRNEMVYFRPRQRLQVLGDQDLVMRFGKSTSIAHAHGSLRIRGKTARSVEFWSESRPQDRVKFQLKALEVKGKITFTPEKAAWPGEGVVAWIALENTGLPPSEWLDLLQIRTQLGIEKLDIKWKEKGRYLRGVIAPRKGLGPWVIRVTVEDISGRSITRNFHEVSGVRRLRQKTAKASVR